MKVLGIIWAGGEGRRMAGIDKALVLLERRPLIEHVISRLESQVDQVMINSSRMKSFGPYQILSDVQETERDDVFKALESCLRYFLKTQEYHYLVHVPTDTPNLPDDLVDHLCKAPKKPAYVRTPGGDQPTVGIWDRASASRALDFLDQYDGRLAKLFDQMDGSAVSFPSDDPFTNINTIIDIYAFKRSQNE